MCSQKEQGLTNRSSRNTTSPSPDMHHICNSLTIVGFNRKEKNKSKNKHSEQDNLSLYTASFAIQLLFP